MAAARSTWSASSARGSRGAPWRSAAPRRSSTTSCPYVNERVAFGEPISNRQAVAFAVADIAIELEGMRLLTYRAASRADRGDELRPRGRAGRAAVRREGHADRLRRRAAARRARLHQGAPGRALVPGPAGGGRDGGRPARLERAAQPMINLEITKEARAARRPGTSGRRRRLPADLAQVRPR